MLFEPTCNSPFWKYWKLDKKYRIGAVTSMKIGNLTEMIRSRSIEKQILHRRCEIPQGADPVTGTSLIKLKEGETLVMSSLFYLDSLKKSRDIVDMALNSIVVKAAEPIALLLGILLPPEAEEDSLRSLIKEVNQVCEQLCLEFIVGQTEVTVAVNRPVLSITAIGKKADASRVERGRMSSQELVMTGWAGMEGTAILAREKIEQLGARYPRDFLEEAGEEVSLSVWRAAGIGQKKGVNVMHEVRSGGVFGALCELAVSYQIGFCVDLKKIPIRQESVEICEFFELNPYLLSSRGCLLLVTEHGNELAEALELEGIRASVIGRITDGHDRVILNDGERRFLDPPREDELLKARLF